MEAFHGCPSEHVQKRSLNTELQFPILSCHWNVARKGLVHRELQSNRERPSLGGPQQSIPGFYARERGPNEKPNQ